LLRFINSDLRCALERLSLFLVFWCLMESK